MAAAARQQQRQRAAGWQAASLAAWRQRCGSTALLAAAPRREAWAAQRWQRGSGGQCVSSAMEVGMAAANAATAMLPLYSAAVATKTSAATAMVGAQITTNNQLKGRQQLGNGDGNGEDDSNNNFGDRWVIITLFCDVNKWYCNLFGDVNERVYFGDVNKHLVMLMDRGIVF
jgi:hypothetical protein